MKVVIIGGTAAGMSAAAKLRRTDREAEIVVYEKRKYISFGACSLPYYAGGFFNDPETMIARTPEEMASIGVDIQLSKEVIGIDIKEKTITVRQLPNTEEIEAVEEIEKIHYDRLMIATGGTPIKPPIENIDLEGVYTLQTLEDGKSLRAAFEESKQNRIAIIGGGFIGLEVVDAAKRLGKEVSVFENKSRILSRMFDAEITTMIEQELIEKGVTLRTGIQVLSLQPKDQGQRVKCIVTDQGTFEVDLVVIASGVRPATSFLEGSGIRMLENGAIIVDEKGQTNVEDIYAAGDCATVLHQLQKEAYIPLGTSANKLGRIVGENLGGKESSYQPTLGSSCIKVLGLDAARTGLTEDEARRNGYNIKTSLVTDMNQASYYPGQSKIHVKLIYQANTKVILGAQMVGAKDVVQRVNVLACAIYKQMTTKELGMLDLCYAPPFSKTWDILNVAGNASK